MDKTNIADIVNEYRNSGIEDQVDFKKFYLYSIITHSTAIEGSTLTEIENQLLFDEGITAQGKPMLEQLMNLDLRDAYLYGYSLVDKKIPLTKKVLQSLAAAVMRRTGSTYNTMAGEFDSSKGELRLCNVTAGLNGKSYMSYLKVPGRFEEFSLWLVEALSNLDTSDIYQCYALSFEAHFRLVTIHPWVDGNGRTTRLLMNIIQYMAGVPQTRVLPKDKTKYIQALIDTREQDDIQIFIDVMMKMHADDLKTQLRVYRHDTGDDRINPADDRINPADDRIKSLRDRIKDRITGISGIKPDKLLLLCQFVSVNPTATIPEIAKYLEVSEPTVNRYVKVLREAEILSRKGARKNGHWAINDNGGLDDGR